MKTAIGYVMNRTCQIYMIENLETGDAYIGSSIQTRQRRSNHFSMLRHSKHHCLHLQRAFTKYGEAAFAHSIVETFTPESNAHRLMIERAWIDLRGTYNTLVSDERSGQFTLTEEVKRERSIATLNRIAERPEYRAILAERGRALATQARSAQGRANMSEHSRRRHADPEERVRLLSGFRDRWENPEKREANVTAQAEMLRERWKKEGVKERHGDAMRAQWADPNSGLNNRAQTRWADPEAKERQAAKMRAYHLAQRGGKPTPVKDKKEKPVTMGDLVLAEMRANPLRNYMPSDLRRVCDPERLAASTLITVTLGRLCQRGFVKKANGGYQLA